MKLRGFLQFSLNYLEDCNTETPNYLGFFLWKNLMMNNINKVQINRQISVGLFLLIIGLFFSSYIASINTSDAAIWLAACALGFSLQKSRFCFASSFRDLFLFGSGQNMKGVLIALTVSSIGFIGILNWILPNPLAGEYPSSAHVLPVGLSTIVAGVLFGVGMVISGGCISGTIYRVAEGYVASVITLFGVIIGSILLIITWDFWWVNFINNESKIFLPSTYSLGYGMSLLLTLIGLFIIYILVLFFESKSGIVEYKIKDIKSQEPENLTDKLKISIHSVFIKSWSIKFGGLSVGFISIVYFLFHSPPGVTGEIMKQSLTISKIFNFSDGVLSGIGSLSGCLGSIESSGIISHTFVSTVGVFFGALISALFSNEFKIRRPKEIKRYYQSLSGGVMMGYSASLGIGCTIGAFLSAIPSLSLSGWVFGLSLFFGSFIGTKIIRRLG